MNSIYTIIIKIISELDVVYKQLRCVEKQVNIPNIYLSHIKFNFYLFLDMDVLNCISYLKLVLHLCPSPKKPTLIGRRKI